MNSPEDDRPEPPPRRDPLLDDPAFAELVGPPVPKPPAAEPLYADPVEATAEELPIAELAAPLPPSEPPPVRPKAIPVPPVAASKPAFPKPVPAPAETTAPRPQWFAACSVIGCFGVFSLAALAALIWIAITLLSNIGDKIADKRRDRDDVVTKVKAGPVAPTMLANDITVDLAGRVDAVGRGGSGRFLLLRIPTRSEIHVFDVNAAEIVHRIPVGESGAIFAGGASKLFVYRPAERSLVRFDLLSGAKDGEAKLPRQTPLIKGLAVGAGVDGPIHAIAGTPNGPMQVLVFDGITLAQNRTFPLADHRMHPNENVHARSSDDGALVAISTANGAIALTIGTQSLRLMPLKPRLGSLPAWATPAPDGRYLFTPRGVFAADGEPVLGNGRDGLFCFPTDHGSDWFLSLETSDGQVEGLPQVHATRELRLTPLESLEKGELSGDLPANELRPLTPDDRVHYWPAAGLVAIVGGTGQKLELYKVDIPKK